MFSRSAANIRKRCARRATSGQRVHGRKVIAMMSANHVNPDLAAEIYVLDGPLNFSE